MNKEEHLSDISRYQVINAIKALEWVSFSLQLLAEYHEPDGANDFSCGYIALPLSNIEKSKLSQICEQVTTLAEARLRGVLCDIPREF